MTDTQTPIDYEAECREFATQYPTPNVRAAIGYAAEGTLTWVQVHNLFHSALTTGIAGLNR